MSKKWNIMNIYGGAPDENKDAYLTECHTPVPKSRTEASIRVPRMFKSHA
jgi:hypothetical protein